MNKLDKLFEIHNDWGYTNLEVISQYKDKQGEVQFGKWNKYEQTDMNNNYLVKQLAHRTVADVELMIDVDDTKVQLSQRNGKFIYYEFQDIKHKVEWIVKKLGRDGLKHSNIHKDYWRQHRKPTVWITGGKGYHVSVVVWWFRLLSEYERKRVKHDLLLSFGGETSKASKRVPIMLEYCKHRKTGKVKREVVL